MSGMEQRSPGDNPQSPLPSPRCTELASRRAWDADSQCSGRLSPHRPRGHSGGAQVAACSSPGWGPATPGLPPPETQCRLCSPRRPPWQGRHSPSWLPRQGSPHFHGVSEATRPMGPSVGQPGKKVALGVTRRPGDPPGGEGDQAQVPNSISPFQKTGPRGPPGPQGPPGKPGQDGIEVSVGCGKGPEGVCGLWLPQTSPNPQD